MIISTTVNDIFMCYYSAVGQDKQKGDDLATRIQVK